MPYTADVDTIASKVVKGDHIRIITGSRDYTALVETVKVGVKWTEARDVDGKLIFRKENTDQVWAMREVPTEAEIAAKEEASRQAAQEFRFEQLHKMHDRMHGMIEVARTDLATKLARGEFIRANDTEELITAQEYKNLAVTIDQGLKNHEDWTILDCMEALSEQIKEALINGHNEPTQSGGFTFNNAERQLKIEAQRKFLRGVNWGIL